MQYSSLSDLIKYLENGTKLHIGVLFFGSYGNEHLFVPHDNTIHSGEVCQKSKETPQKFRRCFRCRNTAIKKAFKTKTEFGGMCINGIYEYTKPVTYNDDVVCIVYIGNIMPENTDRLFKGLGKNIGLAETLEKNFDFEKCRALGNLIESYIRMVLLLTKNSTGFDPLIENMKNYIDSNLEYDIKLSQIAGIFHYNEKYLGRLFKSKTGISLCEYINMQRLKRAKEHLKEKGDTVTDIAHKCGFNNVTYFNRIFKKHFGITPTAYRKI